MSSKDEKVNHRHAWQQGFESALVFRLALQKRFLTGLHGHLKKQGTGQSIDFNDHRPYVNGDDIRFVNWKTYARTGQLVLKTFEDEVSPYADIVVDFSQSMFLTEEKSQLVYQLLGFLSSSCQSIGFNVKLYTISGDKIVKINLTTDGLMPDFPRPEANENLNLDQIDWHAHGLRILVSDLLFSEEPAKTLRQISKTKGFGAVFCPFDSFESDPSWEDITEIEEVENGQKHWLQATSHLMKQYRKRYGEHFDKWEKSCMGVDYSFCRLHAQQSWKDNLINCYPAVEVI
jgi:uncharacterized protein (DUF58 family)